MARKNNYKDFAEKQFSLFGGEDNQENAPDPVAVSLPVEPQKKDEPVSEIKTESVTEVVVNTASPESILAVLDKIEKSTQSNIQSMTLDEFQNEAFYGDRFVLISNDGLKKSYNSEDAEKLGNKVNLDENGNHVKHGIFAEKNSDYILTVEMEEGMSLKQMKEEYPDRTVYVQKFSNVEFTDELQYIEKNIKLYDRFTELRKESIKTSKTNDSAELDDNELSTILDEERVSVKSPIKKLKI